MIKSALLRGVNNQTIDLSRGVFWQPHQPTPACVRPYSPCAECVICSNVFVRERLKMVIDYCKAQKRKKGLKKDGVKDILTEYQSQDKEDGLKIWTERKINEAVWLLQKRDTAHRMIFCSTSTVLQEGTAQEDDVLIHRILSCLPTNNHKKLIRRWESERGLSFRRHRTLTTKYNRLVHKFRQSSTRLCVGTQVYQSQWNNALQRPLRVQGHSRSPILVPTESSYTTSY